MFVLFIKQFFFGSGYVVLASHGSLKLIPHNPYLYKKKTGQKEISVYINSN